MVKNWQADDVYNFSDEFNRLGTEFNSCKDFIVTCLKWTFSNEFTFYTNWDYSDIVDLNNFNNFKTNINKLLDAIDSNYLLMIDETIPQYWDSAKANELENALSILLEYINYENFGISRCGTKICGNNLKNNV